MGSKRLRAIAVRGTQHVGVEDDSVIRGIAEWTRKKLADDLRIRTLHDFGQAGDMIPQNEYGGLPTRNFRQGQFEGIDTISGEYMAEHLRVRGDTCYACGIACKSVVAAEGPYEIDAKYGGPEYESIAALGSNCAIASMEAICKANELCNAYGLDTIGVGGTIAWAMEACEQGLIPPERTGTLPIEFGNAESLLTLVECIARREGIGDWLANGAYACARELQNGSESFVVHVKGQEAPMHDPRLKSALAVGYATSPTGADHMHNIHDTLYETAAGLGDLRTLGILNPLPATDLSPAKMRMAKHTICWNVMWNCVGLCQIYRFARPHMRDLVASATGWDLSIFELQAIGERAHALAREFNRLCGKGAESDTVPPRLMAKLENGPCAGQGLPERELSGALIVFYDMMGWDHDTGAPLEWKLRELGLDWVADQRWTSSSQKER